MSKTSSPCDRRYRVRNWNHFQHFKDRTPPWIKLYRDILEQRDIAVISDRAFRVLVGCWLLASEDKDGKGNLPPISDVAFRLRMQKDAIIKAFDELSPFLVHDDIGVISERYQGDTPETETEGETKTEADGSTAFDTFWKAYPRKVGKDQARKAWAARKKDLPPIADLLAAVKAQSASTQWTRDGGEYIPHPSTWLNQGRWQDEGIDVAQVTPRKTLSARDRMNMTSDEIAAHERTHGVQGELLT